MHRFLISNALSRFDRLYSDVNYHRQHNDPVNMLYDIGDSVNELRDLNLSELAMSALYAEMGETQLRDEIKAVSPAEAASVFAELSALLPQGRYNPLSFERVSQWSGGRNLRAGYIRGVGL